VSSKAHRYPTEPADAKAKVGVESEVVPVGPVMVGTGGGVRSTVKVADAEPEALPAASRATTENV
jgi:hypothetical protein